MATFTATDPEGATPITWSLLDSGTPGDIAADDYADVGDFTIDSEDGVLKFNIASADDGSSLGSPDFENGQGSGTGNNTYKVVVAACDVAADDCTGGMTGYHKVTVKVTNVAETGKVTWTVDPDGAGDLSANVSPAKPIMQFQVGAILMVAENGGVTDGDVSGATKDVTERLQWYRSPSKTAMGTAIDDQSADTYIVTTDDVGMYLRVEAFYNVGTAGREESASLTSDYPVLGSRSSNDAPEFSPATVTREVSEGDKGMAVGAPVTATDDITNALNYTLGGTDAAKFKIDQKTGQITTMEDLDREHTGADVAATDDTPGMFGCGNDYECEVTVTATDSAGAATGATGNPDNATVTITLKNVDEKPKFDTGFKMRDVMEGMTQVDDDANADNDPAGEAIYAATDPDSVSLTYDLMGADRAKFQLSASRSLSFRAKPDYEMPTDANKDNVYEVTVRASDGTMYADRMVMVTVIDVNDAPEIMGKDSVEYPENGKDPVATFTATDPEGVTPITWSLLDSGTPGDIAADDYADVGDFTIDSEDGVLKFNIASADDGSSPGSPDFENPQGGSPATNTYKVVVAACDVTADDCTGGMTGYHKVTVKVTNVAETGKVTWTVNPNGTSGPPNANVLDTDNTPIMQFQVGASLTASATDGDIAEATKDVTATHNLRWRWYRGSAEIDEQITDTYIVTTDDINRHLRVTASYTVSSTSREESASLTSDYPVLGSRSGNDAPEFDPDEVTREVSEGKKGMTVGAPVKATDDITNALNYTLGGTDAAKFKIDQKTGQITTMEDLDREHTGADVAATDDTPGMFGCGNDYECEVIVTATDSAGAATGETGNPADATVTITLKNVDEKPEFDDGDKMVSVAEGSKEVRADSNNDGDNDSQDTVNPYTAMDQDGLRVNLTLMGADGAKFQLLSGGNLSFKTAPDYEMPTDRNKDNVYEVTVRASDGTMYADRMVMVTVTDFNEAPEIIGVGLSIYGSSSIHFSEGETDAEATFTARGPMKDMARWTLQGDDARYFSVGTARGAMTELMFSSAPDYEMPRGRAMSDSNTNTYMVTLKANDGTYMDTHDVTVMVTNMKEDGTVMLSSMTPVVGVELTASLTDSDGGVMDVTWVWETSSDMSTWAAGSGTDEANADGTASTYTPDSADDGMYLRATAMYTDDYDSGNEEMATTTRAVTAGDPLVIMYDTNGTPGIQKDEVITAINEYLDAGADAPSKADVIKLINLYLDS